MISVHKYCLLVLLVLITISGIFAQENILSSEKRDSLISLFEHIKKSKSDVEKKEINSKAILLIQEILNDSKLNEHVFDSVASLGKLMSVDKRLLIVNWNLFLEDGSYKHFGFIKYFSKNRKSFQVFELKERTKDITDPSFTSLSNDIWYGALYYQIIETSFWGTKYYTLLGWDGLDDLKNKKVIDVLYFSRNGKPKFGAPVFLMENKTLQTRVIFEYANRASMALTFDVKRNMLVFDHLSPSSKSLEGMYQYYGPDGSYDAFKFKKGKWRYVPDIDARNPKPIKKSKK